MSSTISAASSNQFVAPPKPVESRPAPKKVEAPANPEPMTKAPEAESKNQKEAVLDVYASQTDSENQTAANVENAREEVKRLYEASRLEESQQISAEGSMRAGEIDPEQQRVREDAEVRSAMVQDKAAAQAAQLKARRDVVQDKVTLAKEQNYRDQFESFALAREMIALRDSELDKLETQITGKQMAAEDIKSIASKDKVNDDKNVVRMQEQTMKIEKASSRRLDMITPGTFEAPAQEITPQAPDINIVNSLRQSHEFDLNPNASSAQDRLESTEKSRSNAAEQFDTMTMDEPFESNQRATPDFASRAISEMKEAAARNGLVTLNSSERAEQVAQEVIQEARKRPEQAIASQSQVSLQAALKMLQ
jgi:hypothetical protein